MVFSFATVERVLAYAHRVGDDRRSAFKSRLQHLQKRGFPAGTKTGRGRAASYSVEHVIKIALLLELNQMGIAPERALWILRLDMSRAKMAVRMALRTMLSGDPLPMFLTFDPGGLDDLKHPTDTDDAAETFHYAGLGQLLENVSNWGEAGVRRVALINVSAMLVVVLTELAHLVRGNRIELMRSALEWADTNSDVDDIEQLEPADEIGSLTAVAESKRLKAGSE